MNSHNASSLYQQILFEDLKISDGFLRSYEQVIREKLIHASADLDRTGAEDYLGINQCLHLAASLVLRNPRFQDSAMEVIRHKMETHGQPDQDPATIASISTLYYILTPQFLNGLSDIDKTGIDRIRETFANLDWLVGPQSMKLLGFDDGYH